MAANFSANEILGNIDQSIRKEFESNKRILSFDEYLSLIVENPGHQLRGAAKYMLDMMDFFGREPASTPAQQDGTPVLERFKVFDRVWDGLGRKVVGQEHVQNQIYRALKTFSRQGLSSKLLLLHGPNGSAKTSVIHAIMGGMEAYSNEAPGALYSFSWIFPVERYTKGSIGLNAGVHGPNAKNYGEASLQSYAKLPETEIAAKNPV